MIIKNNPAHIAFFLPAMNSGGAEKTVLMLATAFANRGIKTDILLVRKEGVYIPRIPKNIRVIELGAKGMVQSIFPLMNYLKAERPDVLISGLPGPNVITLMARHLTQKATSCATKIIITQHHPFTQNAAASTKLRTKIRTALARFLFKRADEIIAVSDGVATDLAAVTGIPRVHITTINNPLDLAHIADYAVKPVTHPWLADPAIKILISVGRLAPPKDYETLLLALSEIPNIKLLICGEGPGRSKITNLITTLNLQDRVQLLGFVDNIYASVAAADALILSSKHEGFGNVLIEAMAVGTPIIATDCPYGPAEITQNGKYGYLAPIADSAAMQSAITQTLKKPPQTAEALKNHAKKFSIDNIMKEYLKLMS